MGVGGGGETGAPFVRFFDSFLNNVLINKFQIEFGR